MTENSKHLDGGGFVSLMSANQRRILAYIITLIPNRSDAEDIMQETTALMWEKKNDFIPGTDFVAWGTRIAYHKILNYRKKAINSRQMIFNDEQFKRIQKQAIEKSSHVDEMLYKLDECIKKISNSDRQLIYMRYSKEISVKEISSCIKKSVRSVYLSIARIQGLLLRCIEGSDV